MKRSNGSIAFLCQQVIILPYRGLSMLFIVLIFLFAGTVYGQETQKVVDQLVPYAQLENIDLRKRNLRHIDLHSANLRGADLRGADLYGADLSGSNLCCVKIRGVNLTASNLTQANLSYIDFRGVSLIEVILTQAFFENAIWTNGRRCQKGSIGKCLF